MSITAEHAKDILGGTLHGAGGEKIGKIGQVFLDDQTGRPEWATVSTGFFGSNESFVPLEAASVNGSDVTVAYDKARIKGAPNVDPSGGHISESEEEALYTYYGLSRSSVRTDGTAGYQGTAGYAERGTVGHDTSGPNTDDAMTRSEERLVAGKETVEAGRARLRKYVTTETQSVTVPVTEEHARLVTEPITDANRAAATDGPTITEAEHEVVLHAERPVVATEAVPIERVRLETEAETVQQSVSGTVRKEHIEFEDDTAVRDGDRLK